MDFVIEPYFFKARKNFFKARKNFFKARKKHQHWRKISCTAARIYQVARTSIAGTATAEQWAFREQRAGLKSRPGPCRQSHRPLAKVRHSPPDTQIVLCDVYVGEDYSYNCVDKNVPYLHNILRAVRKGLSGTLAGFTATEKRQDGWSGAIKRAADYFLP